MANDKTGVAMNGNERVTSIADYLDSHFEPPCEPYINEMHAYVYGSIIYYLYNYV